MFYDFDADDFSSVENTESNQTKTTPRTKRVKFENPSSPRQKTKTKSTPAPQWFENRQSVSPPRVPQSSLSTLTSITPETESWIPNDTQLNYDANSRPTNPLIDAFINQQSTVLPSILNTSPSPLTSPTKSILKKSSTSPTSSDSLSTLPTTTTLPFNQQSNQTLNSSKIKQEPTIQTTFNTNMLQPDAQPSTDMYLSNQFNQSSHLSSNQQAQAQFPQIKQEPLSNATTQPWSPFSTYKSEQVVPLEQIYSSPPIFTPFAPLPSSIITPVDVKPPPIADVKPPVSILDIPVPSSLSTPLAPLIPSLTLSSSSSSPPLTSSLTLSSRPQTSLPSALNTIPDFDEIASLYDTLGQTALKWGDGAENIQRIFCELYRNHDAKSDECSVDTVDECCDDDKPIYLQIQNIQRRSYPQLVYSMSNLKNTSNDEPSVVVIEKLKKLVIDIYNFTDDLNNLKCELNKTFDSFILSGRLNTSNFSIESPRPEHDSDLAALIHILLCSRNENAATLLNNFHKNKDQLRSSFDMFQSEFQNIDSSLFMKMFKWTIFPSHKSIQERFCGLMDLKKCIIKFIAAHSPNSEIAMATNMDSDLISTESLSLSRAGKLDPDWFNKDAKDDFQKFFKHVSDPKCDLKNKNCTRDFYDELDSDYFAPLFGSICQLKNYCPTSTIDVNVAPNLWCGLKYLLLSDRIEELAHFKCAFEQFYIQVKNTIHFLNHNLKNRSLTPKKTMECLDFSQICLPYISSVRDAAFIQRYIFGKSISDIALMTLYSHKIFSPQGYIIALYGLAIFSNGCDQLMNDIMNGVDDKDLLQLIIVMILDFVNDMLIKQDGCEQHFNFCKKIVSQKTVSEFVKDEKTACAANVVKFYIDNATSCISGFEDRFTSADFNMFNLVGNPTLLLKSAPYVDFFLKFISQVDYSTCNIAPMFRNDVVANANAFFASKIGELGIECAKGDDDKTRVICSDEMHFDNLSDLIIHMYLNDDDYEFYYVDKENLPLDKVTSASNMRFSKIIKHFPEQSDLTEYLSFFKNKLKSNVNFDEYDKVILIVPNELADNFSHLEQVDLGNLKKVCPDILFTLKDKQNYQLAQVDNDLKIGRHDYDLNAQSILKKNICFEKKSLKREYDELNNQNCFTIPNKKCCNNAFVRCQKPKREPDTYRIVDKGSEGSNDNLLLIIRTGDNIIVDDDESLYALQRGSGLLNFERGGADFEEPQICHRISDSDLDATCEIKFKQDFDFKESNRLNNVDEYVEKLNFTSLMAFFTKLLIESNQIQKEYNQVNAIKLLELIRMVNFSALELLALDHYQRYIQLYEPLRNVVIPSMKGIFDYLYNSAIYINPFTIQPLVLCTELDKLPLTAEERGTVDYYREIAQGQPFDKSCILEPVKQTLRGNFFIHLIPLYLLHKYSKLHNNLTKNFYNNIFFE